MKFVKKIYSLKKVAFKDTNRAKVETKENKQIIKFIIHSNSINSH